MKNVIFGRLVLSKTITILGVSYSLPLRILEHFDDNPVNKGLYFEIGNSAVIIPNRNLPIILKHIVEHLVEQKKDFKDIF